MQRLAAIMLLLSYAALGSGGAEYLHNAAHAAQDATIVNARKQSGPPLNHFPLHDESNCPIHAQLHVCCMAVSWIPPLVCVGLFVAFLTLHASRLAVQRIALAMPCRGPPIR